MKWLFRLYLLLSVTACVAFYGPKAKAHNDGSFEPNTSGHVYGQGTTACKFVGATSGSNNARLTPQELADCYNDATGLVVSVDSVGWDEANSRWAVAYRLTDNSVQNTFITEYHCPLGQFYNDSTHVCEVQLGGACDYGGIAVNYESNSAGTTGLVNLYDDVQDQTCLFSLTSSYDNGDGTYTITLDDTLWREADENNFTTAPPDGTAIPDAPEPIESPFQDTGGYGGLPPEERCNVDLPAFWVEGYPHENPQITTICMANGCQGEYDSTQSRVCLGTANSGDPGATCGAYFKYNATTCNGGEGWSQRSIDGGPGGASGDMSGVEARLDAIYGRLGSQTDAIIASQALGDAAIVDAINDNGGTGGGGGECEGSSCDGTVPADGEAVGTVEDTTQSYVDRLAAAPIVDAIVGIPGSIPEGTCSGYETDQIEFFSGTSAEYIEFDFHCTLWPEIAPFVQTGFLVIYTLGGAFIFMRA